jgi:hypothetical protein
MSFLAKLIRQKTDEPPETPTEDDPFDTTIASAKALAKAFEDLRQALKEDAAVLKECVVEPGRPAGECRAKGHRT